MNAEISLIKATRQAARKTSRWDSILFISALILSIGLHSCATNPVSKKQQFVLMSEEQELKIGKTMDPQIIKEYGLYDNPALQEYVDSIGQKIAKKSDRPELFYHFKVLDSPMVNAFALPGGYIYMTRGILAVLNNEAELAGVLGHEIGHVTARHAVQQYTQSQGYQILATVASIFVPEFQNRNLQQLADIAAMGIIRGYGREMEMESDRLGIKYSYKTRYNPKAVPDFLKILKLVNKENEKGGYHGLFATHPDTTKRIKAAQKKSKAILAKKNKPKLAINTDKYLSQIEGLVYGANPKEGIINGSLFQHPEMQFEITYPDGWKIDNAQKAVIAKDRDKNEKYAVELTVETLGKRITAKRYAEKFFKRNRIKPLTADRDKINGLEAYITTFEDKDKSSKKIKVMVAFILWQDKMFLVAGFSEINDFNVGETFFRQVIYSFRGLSKSEITTIKPERIKIHIVKEGETIKSIAKTFKKDPKKSALINGFEKEDVSLKAGKKIKVLDNF